MKTSYKLLQKWEAGNLKKAEQLLVEAAAAGDGYAAHNFGTLYAKGGPGVNADSAKSRRYYEQALASGFEESVASDPTWFRELLINSLLVIPAHAGIQ